MPVYHATGGHPGRHMGAFDGLLLAHVHRFLPEETNMDWEGVPDEDKLTLRDLRFQKEAVPFATSFGADECPGATMYKCVCLGCFGSRAPLRLFIGSHPHPSALNGDEVTTFKTTLCEWVTRHLGTFYNTHPNPPYLHEDWFWQTYYSEHRVTWMFYLQAAPLPGNQGIENRTFYTYLSDGL